MIKFSVEPIFIYTLRMSWMSWMNWMMARSSVRMMMSWYPLVNQILIRGEQPDTNQIIQVHVLYSCLTV